MKNASHTTPTTRAQIENRNSKTENPTAFSLVELLIVISVVGILAAIVIPTLQDHSQKAKETAAKANLRTLREAIERYKLEHNDIPPGYPDNDPTEMPLAIEFYRQLVKSGKYLKSMPKNSFNGNNGLAIVLNGQSFPETADGTSGWIYKPETRQIRINWPGTDSAGEAFFDY